ncbi:MAG: sel1 repeat family protein [Deltaproteobacteria bacterium]|nr:sel1 repeat family protein [Deltaproteobacteria bacterium]
MFRFTWIVIAGVACGGKKDEPKVVPPAPDAAVAKVEPPKPDASNERPPDDKAPPPVVKPVEGDCNRKTEDVALVAVCEYRCTSLKEADACAIGAKKYYAGDGIKIDQVKGATLVKLACELESADGCTYLARLDTTKADELTAKVTTYLERDCAASQALGCIELAERVKAFDEARAKTELEKGLDLAVAGCDGGDGSLCVAASKILDVAALGIEKDAIKAADLRKRACEAGHAATCVRLSTETDKPDKREALVDKACTFGLRKACAQLASDLSSKNTTRAAKMIERACQLGDGDWCVRIGEDLAKANQRDKAVEMFTRACKLGSDHGCSQARALGAK